MTRDDFLASNKPYNTKPTSQKAAGTESVGSPPKSSRSSRVVTLPHSLNGTSKRRRTPSSVTRLPPIHSPVTTSVKTNSCRLTGTEKPSTRETALEGIVTSPSLLIVNKPSSPRDMLPTIHRHDASHVSPALNSPSTTPKSTHSQVEGAGSSRHPDSTYNDVQPVRVSDRTPRSVERPSTASPALKSPALKSPALKSPALKSPALKSPDVEAVESNVNVTREDEDRLPEMPSNQRDEERQDDQHHQQPQALGEMPGNHRDEERQDDQHHQQPQAVGEKRDRRRRRHHVIDIPDGHVLIETEYGTFVVPKYEEMPQDQQKMHYDTFKLKFKILNDSWKQYGITIDPPAPGETVTNLHVRYKQTVRYLTARSGADIYKIILTFCWLLIEVAAIKLGLEGSGYTVSQLRMYEIYQTSLIEMGETNALGEGWSPITKIVVLSGMNAAIFLVLATFIGNSGGQSEAIMGMLSRFLLGQTPTISTEGNKHGVPQPVENPIANVGNLGGMLGGMNLGGLDVSQIIAQVGTAFTGAMQNRRNASNNSQASQASTQSKQVHAEATKTRAERRRDRRQKPEPED